MIRKNCKNCGQIYWVIKSKYNTSKYCSKKCYGESNKTGNNVICENCGKSFYADKWGIENGRGKNCSKKCQSESNRTGKTVSCSNCKKGFYLSEWENKRHGDLKFCSKSCLHFYQKNKLINNYPKTSHLRNIIRGRQKIIDLDDAYIKSIFNQRKPFPIHDLPKELIELKRLNIKRKRKLNEITHGNSH